MTIRDMFNAGVEFQGETWVRQWDYDNDAYKINKPLSSFEDEFDPVFDKEIVFIYPDVIKPECSWHASNVAVCIEISSAED